MKPQRRALSQAQAQIRRVGPAPSRRRPGNASAAQRPPPLSRYDAGKKINGRKRHIAAGTGGLLLAVLITAASVQDRDAARPLLWNLRRAFPSIALAWADGGYAGKLVTWAKPACT
jgi:hypothetical protein